jgi:glycosyltransferase involved in cell wall biosynthesis
MRGPERTFAAIADLWPDAPIYTLLYDEEATGKHFADRDVRSSLVQTGRVRQRGASRMLPLLPWAARRLDLGEHELVISSSNAFASGVHARHDATHVCYCHSPFRSAWHDRDVALEAVGPVSRPFTRLTMGSIRRGDRRAASRVTDFIANSAITRDRIAEFYERESTVIHPPVEVDRFDVAEPEDYFLVVAELSPHKRVDVALEAARLAGKKVKVVGSGLQYRTLHAEFGGETVEFMRRLTDDELAGLYSRAQALIVANVEEFGIAAVEAQAAGRPVVGIDAGGLRETVVDGLTGVRVADEAALADALRNVDFTRFDPAAIRAHARQFSVERFQREFRRHVDRVVGLNL